MNSKLPDRVEVAQPFVPPLEEFLPYLERIWRTRWLTNNGEFHGEFEVALREYLEVPNISLVSNGTLGLIVALRALGIAGEVVTTPFSFVATTHALHWNGIRPVFADIEPDTFTLDPTRIELAITPETTAILPVHVYGFPCDIDRIQNIADLHGLKVLYDAAHVFGVRCRNKWMLQAGNASVLSFHATKVFTTFEGGAVVTTDEALKRSIDFLKNFGFADETTVVGPGINAKMNEIQAAFGLLQLRHIEEALARRRNAASRYREFLVGVPGIRIPQIPDDVFHNGAYFPVLVEPEYGVTRDKLYRKLRDAGIFARRYFYPLISSFPPYRDLRSASPGNLPVAHQVAARILCLPIHPNLSPADQLRVIDVIRRRL